MDWQDVLVHTTTLESASDVLVTAAVHLSAANTTTGTRVLYRILVNGVGSPHFLRRVPTELPGSLNFSAVFEDVDAGTATIQFQAKQVSGSSPVYFVLTWMTPLLVNAQETTVEANSGALITPLNGSEWTTVQSVSISHAAEQMLAIAAALRIVAGTPGKSLEFRFLADSVQLFLCIAASPDEMPDGFWLSRFYQPGSSSSGRLIELQVRSPTSEATSIQSVHMLAQTMPNYQLFEAVERVFLPFRMTRSSTPFWRAGPFSLIDPISLSANSTAWTGGHAFGVMPPQLSVPLLWRIDLQRENLPPFSFDFGQQTFAAGDHVRLATDLAGGCVTCGFDPSIAMQVRLSARSLCDLPGQISSGVARATAQVIMLHTNFPESCGMVLWRDCCNAQPDCTWSCEVGSFAAGARQ